MWVLVCLTLSVIPVKAVDITGDTVTTNLTVQGNALITGNLQAQGYELKLGQNGTNPGVSINFVPASGSDPSEVQFLQNEHANKGEWVWALRPSSGADKVQMVLGADNFLSLYATNYSSGSPNTGIIVLSPSASGSSISIDGTLVITQDSGDSRYLRGDGTSMALRGGSAAGINSFAGLFSTASGDYSFSGGPYSTAGGIQSIAAGFNTNAAGDGAIAIGANAVASGSVSIANGYNSTANNWASIAIGSFQTATGDYSIVIGSENSAIGSTSLTLGFHNQALVDGAIAWGTNNLADGYSAMAIGLNNSIYSSGNYGVALGNNNSAGESSVALGRGNDAYQSSVTLGLNNEAVEGGVALGLNNDADWYGLAIGTNNATSAFYASAFGWGNSSDGKYSMVLGNYGAAHAMHSVVLGVNNVNQGSPDTWVLADDLLVVGNGGASNNDGGPPFADSPNNAFAIHKNGNTRIAGQLETRGIIRCAKAGDLDMGVFTDGANPADATNGLNAGLRYPTE